MVPTDKMPGIEINIACIILFIEGTIESNRRVLKILKALKTEKGPEAGIKDTTTIITVSYTHLTLPTKRIV